MDNLRPCFKASYGCAARVGKQVEHLYGSACISDKLSRIIPIDCLLGENSRVLEAHGFDIKTKLLIINTPSVGSFS